MILLEQLKQKELFTNAEQPVVDYILENPERILQLSLKQLARESFSSEATVIRTCRKLGVNGFADFKLSLAYELNSFLLRDGKITIDIPIGPEDDENRIAKIFLNLSYHSLTETFQNLDMRKLRRAANMIRRADGVSLYGRGESMIIAEDFHLKLLKIGIRSGLDPNGMQEVRSRGNFTNEVALVVSYYADTRQAQYIVEELARFKTKTILLTANEKSPLVGKVTLPIFVQMNETRCKMGAFASRTAMQYVLDCIYGILFAMDYEKNRKLLEDFSSHRGTTRYI